MKRKIAIVTGAGGFIGSNLTRRLIKDDFEVHIFVRSESSIKRITDIKKLIHIHFTKMDNEKKLKALIEKISPQYIFHLATYENYRDESKISEMFENNILATKNLLLASKDINYNCFINTGSSSEYGIKNKPMNETDILDPVSIYAVTKASTTLLCRVIAKQYNKPIITFRLFSVYGPYEAKSRLIPTAISSFIEGVPLALTSGKIRRDFIYIDDVIDAYIKAAKSTVKFGEVYNIGSGKQYSNDDIVKYLQKITKKRIKINKGVFKKRIWDASFWVANNKKAQRHFKWTAKVKIEEGLTKTYKWLSHHKELYV